MWAGNEDCEPVTWRECQLVPVQVEFKVPKMTCEAGEPISYEDCEEETKEQMTTSMLCEVRYEKCTGFERQVELMITKWTLLVVLS